MVNQLMQRFSNPPTKRLLALVLVALTVTVTVTLAQDSPGGSLAPGEAVTGTISDGSDTVRYTFAGIAGETVVLEMVNTSGDLDPFLVLIGPDSEFVAQDDDGGDGRNARIEASLPRTGVYTVEATRYRLANTTGAFTLLLTVTDATGDPVAVDPLTMMPDFGVQPAPVEVEYQQLRRGTLDASLTQQYFALVGEQGDVVQITMTTSSGNLAPSVNILNQAGLSVTSSVGQARPTESIAYATLPETGWYLIEAGRVAGIGGYNLFISRLVTGAVLTPDERLVGTFEPGNPVISYVFDGRIGDEVAINLFTNDRLSPVQPRLCLLNVQFVELACGEGSRFATVRATLPRSGTYILQATNRAENSGGDFTIRLTSSPTEIDKLPIIKINYNEQVRGAISNASPISYFSFTGKAGERVTIRMTATSGNLDPFLILSDGELTEELIFNDNVSATLNARIVQYRLDRDGDYIILATRAGLTDGASTGGFQLELLAGDVELEAGEVSAWLSWRAAADLNLYVRGPDGRIVSWSNPSVPSGGRLQIDSNTNCETVTDQPIEYVYWLPEALVAGDYEVWVWYQDTCGQPADNAVDFALRLRVGDQLLLETEEQLPGLLPGERFETSFRVVATNEALLVNRGDFTEPSPQQSASQGGDILITYGDVVEDELDDAIFARFYQFFGDAGDEITIEVTTPDSDLDPIVILRDADDRNLPGGLNDDIDGMTRDSRLTYTLPERGQYIIAVTRYGVRNGTTTGAYQLRLNRAVEAEPVETAAGE